MVNLQSIRDLAVQRREIYMGKHNIDPSDDWEFVKLMEEVGEAAGAYLRLKGMARRKGKTDDEIRKDMADELADVLGILALVGDKLGIDLGEAFMNKWGAYDKPS